MQSNAAYETTAEWASPMLFNNLITCGNAQAQCCDLYSRLGISDPPHAAMPGIGRAHLASQREGKTFLEPLLHIQFRDEASQQAVFSKAATSGQHTMTWYPWGFVQNHQEQDLLLRLTAAYADCDTLALQLELFNRGSVPRNLSLQARSLPSEPDQDLQLRPGAPEGLFFFAQSAPPTSSMQIRAEPAFRIVTAFKPLFPAEMVLDGRTLWLLSQPFPLMPGQRRLFDLYISTAAFDLQPDGAPPVDMEKTIAHLLEKRLQDKHPPQVMMDIARARTRWELVLNGLSMKGVEPEYRELVRQAVVILLKNTIRPQPAQGYGTEMGGHLGTFPARAGYEGFWIWDSAKHAWGLRHFNLDLAKENIRIMLHRQQPDGQLFMLHPDSNGPSTQPPLFADAAMRIYASEKTESPNQAKAFLRSVYSKLVLWNQWFFAKCDLDGNGLAGWPDNLTSGWDDSPRWDTDIPAGYRQNHGAAQYEAVDLNSFLVVDLLCLAEMAVILQKPAEAAQLRQQAETLRAKILADLYCAEDNLFYDRHRENGKWNRIKTPACFMPLWAGVPLPPEKIKTMLQDYLLSEAHFFGPYPFPSVAYSEARYDAGGGSGYWRGPTWLDQAWFMLAILHKNRALLDESYQQKIDVGRARVLDMVKHAGFHENFNSQTGCAGVWSREHFSWTAAVVMEIAKRQF